MIYKKFNLVYLMEKDRIFFPKRQVTAQNCLPKIQYYTVNI